MALTIDTGTAYGRRVLRRLNEEIVIWLTTVDGNGTPEPSPVWFLWQDDESILIYSQRNKPKLRNIAARPNVALSFNTTSDGGDVIVFTGAAEIVAELPSASEIPAYVEKYQRSIANLGYSPEQFAGEYAVPVRVTLDRVRGF